ncbi:MAG: Ig-like domain-containing protein [Verrucomicrobia bacterium]|nr:Ig-like domain-containing protein [Verrucomicrobiota bacterium]
MTSTQKRLDRHWYTYFIISVCAALALLLPPATTRAATVTETFDSYANGTVLTTIGGSGVWTIGANTVIDAGGVAGTKGLSSSGTIFNWKGQPFQWSTLAAGTKLTMSLDFQSDASSKFDDDRVGWTITPDASTSTGSQLALKLDNNQEGGMVLYHNSTRTPALNALSGIKASTWYRFSVEFTKLTDTSAAIVGTLTELDATGNPTGTPYVGTIADTSAFSNPPSTALFTATQQCPSFKNYNAIVGNADNAAFTITPPTPPPTVTLSLTGSPMAEEGGVATVTATLSAAYTQPVTVNLAFSGTATLTTDYTRSATNIVIAAGSTNGSITLTAVQDTVYENPNETIVVDIDTVVNGTESGTQQVTATISNDDPVPGGITLLNENFDSMGSAGTAPPTGWTIGYLAGNPSRVVMSPYGGDGLAITPLPPLVVSDGVFATQPTTATGFNFGSTGSSERALGSFPRTTTYGDHVMQIAVVNTTGGSLNSVDVSYAGEQWRQCQGTSSSGPEMLRFLASTTSPTTGFSNYSSLDFTAPKQGPADIALDGNLAANRAVLSGTIKFASAVPAGGTFYLRWHDWNDNATYDHFLAIDDVIVTTTAAPPPPPTVMLALTGSPIAEAGGVATVTATLSAAYPQPVTVNLAFSGTATLSTDYTPSATNIVIAAGSTNGSITLTAVQDTLYENPNETIVVDIDTVVNGTESGTQQVTAIITDDDPAPVVTLLNENFDSMGSAGTAPPTGWTIGYLAGNPSRVVMSPYAGDGLAITAITPLVVSDGSFDDNTAHVFNFGSTGSSERALGSFPRTTTYGDHVMQIAVVNTTGGSLTSVNVSYAGEQWRQCQGASSSGPEMLRFLVSTTSPITGFSNYTSLDFTAPKQAAASPYIALDGNLAANRAVITGTITFASPVPAGGTFYLRWHDWNDNGTYDHYLAIDDVIVSTTAAPPPTPTVALALTGSPMAEAGGVATVTATLSAAYTQPVTVNLAFSGTATLTTDYTRSATNIVIAAGSSNGSITLTAVQDTLYENPNETIVVDIDTVVNGTESGTQQVTVIITDDDPAPNYRSYTGVPLAENFDGLGTNGTTLTPLLGWDAGQFNPVQANQPGPGNGIATVTDTSLVVDDGTIFLANATASIGNLGSTGSADRALGAMPKTASGDLFYQLAIKNDSGSPLASFVLSFTGEQWVNANSPSTPTDYLTVWFSDSNPTNGYVSMGSGFTFTALKSNATGAVLNGNDPANRTAISGIFTPAVPIAPGNVFYIRWYDRNDAAQDHVLAIDDLTVRPVMRPLVSITNPVNNATVAVGSPITVEATASDPDGTVTNVAFYADGNLLSSDAAAPYNYTWATAAPGPHALTAVAWDNMGLSSTSTVVNITVGSEPVQYVIVISVDGLGGTYLNKIFNGTATGGPYTLTNFNRLRNEGASTLAAHCDNNNWETLPNHTSIVTARPQLLGTNGHNWTLNSDPAVGQTIHSVRGFYVFSVFDVAHDNGLRTGMYANKSKFSLFDTTAAYTGGGSYNATYGAPDLIGVDNGRDKVDNTYINTTLGGIIVNTFIAQQKTASSNQYAFIHIN